MIVGFSGLDGCGKSTYISRFADSCSAETFVLWTRVGNTPGMDTLKGLARRILRGKLPPPGRSEQRSKAMASPLIQRVWISLALIELMWIFIIKIRYYSMSRILLLDRQLEDSIVDLKVLFGEEVVDDWLYKKLLYFIEIMMPKVFRILIDIDIDTSDTRCSQKHEPFPDTPDEKKRRFKFYEKMELRSKYELILDGTVCVDDNFQVILKRVGLTYV